MLKTTEPDDDKREPSRSSGPLLHAGVGELDRIVAAVRRQLRMVALCSILGVVVAAGYVMTAAPLYTASLALLIDNKRVRAVQDSYDVTAQGFEVLAAIDSQVELLKSDKLATTVMDKLQLLKDPEFGHAGPGLISRILSGLWSSAVSSNIVEPTEEDAERARQDVLQMLRNNLDVRRVQRTLVLEISYRSRYAAKAARIANAFADAYLVDQLDAKYDATRRASSWLLDRMAELKQQVLTSDLAIQKFKADNDLISSGGRLVNDQQLGEVNSQLVVARTDMARAKARYGRIKAIIDGRLTDAVVTEAIGNTVIEQLRTKFLSAAKREAELSSKLGSQHGAVAALRREMRDYEKLMFEELSRIAESYLSELDIAQARERSLNASLNSLMGVNASANKSGVALRELEREAESYRNLYQSFLQRYQEAIQLQSFPITEARVITSASKPQRPSHPKKSLLLALSFVVGGAMGVCVGILREHRDRALRTAEQVRDELGLKFLGLLPFVKPDKDKRTRRRAAAERGADEGEDKRLTSGSPSIMRYALDHPLSSFAETLRAVKIAADLTIPGRKPKVLGIVSALPGEGKSTVAKNLATLLAHLGTSTLLIDADLRNPGLSGAVCPDAKEGLVEAVLDGKPMEDLLWKEPGSALSILPAVVKRQIAHTSEFLASPGMKALLERAEQVFPYIVIDLPPLGLIVDARAITPEIDAFLVVAEWGRTPRQVLRSTLEADLNLRDKCLGIVLNKVDMRALKLYEGYASNSYYNTMYAKYYYKDEA